MQYICANKDKDFLKRKQEGALAHLARARHWQCRGDEFESHTLHLIKKPLKISGFFINLLLPILLYPSYSSNRYKFHSTYKLQKKETKTGTLKSISKP